MSGINHKCSNNCDDNHREQSTEYSYDDIYGAIRRNDQFAFEKIINDYGIRCFKQYDSEGYSPLHVICLAGNFKFFENIINSFFGTIESIELDERSKNDWSANLLHCAAVSGNLNLCKKIIDLKIDINSKDAKLCTPFILSCKYGHFGLCIYLYGSGADIFSRDEEGDTGLHWAAYKGYFNITNYLICIGLSVDSVDNFGQNPIHLACVGGSLPTVRCLVNNKSSVDNKDSNGKRPIDLAKGRNHQDIINFILSMSYSNSSSIFSIERLRYKFKSLMLQSIIYWMSIVSIIFVRVLERSFIYYVFMTSSILIPVALIIHFLLFYSLKNSRLSFVEGNVSMYNDYLKKISIESSEENAQIIEKKLSKICHPCKIIHLQDNVTHCDTCCKCYQKHFMHSSILNHCICQGNRFKYLLFTSLRLLLSVNVLYIIPHLIFYHFGVANFILQLMIRCLLIANALSSIFEIIFLGILVTYNESMYEYQTKLRTRGYAGDLEKSKIIKNWRDILKE